MSAVHHYVPRFLLKNFCSEKKQRVWVFDKKTGASFQANVQKVAGERKFYETEIGERRISFEQPLSILEGAASKVLRRITETRNLGALTSDDRVTVALFAAIQMLRAPSHRELLLAMDKLLRQAIERWGADPNDVEGYHPLTPASAKAVSVMSLADPGPYVSIFLDKTWLLFETKPSCSYFIADSPIALQNLEDRGPRGNLGIAVEGIEIYLPLSQTLTLAFYCKTHEAKVREVMDRHQALLRLMPAAASAKFAPLLELFDGMTKGTPIRSGPRNVENLNSLQVRFAERFVFSSSPDFSLAKEMIADEPRYKTGRRAELAH